ncbi:hypothetical protein D9619_000270 [Psilocybe cf. subviscida]|uniref:Aminoglycoside phosphotransferase domain-containing protein n=1 Tax=Psilocybe cf. subviscida TaxID=2480587 RepID=A0A8H5F3S0_9AGAR|nr:hypothetical protein D9619_000270 [Psilocybe cf. subviscida]
MMLSISDKYLTPDWSTKANPWEGVELDLAALQKIVCEVLRVPLSQCGPPVSLLDEDSGCCGNHSRIYSFQLAARTVVARLITPVKPLFKTESEVAAMDFIRSHTTLPVPQVFSYCSEANNPVGAEWMIMEHVLGKEMGDVWDDLLPAQRQRLARDVVDLHDQLSKLKADGCGGIYHTVHSVDDFNLSRTPRWRPLSKESLQLLRNHCSHALRDGYTLGPVNSVPLVNWRVVVPSPAQTPPVYSSEAYVDLVASYGKPSTRSYYELFSRETCVKLFRHVRNLYPSSRILGPLSDSSGYGFTHGDLHEGNIFVDPHTGAITGIIDWESAEFRPMWTEVAGVGWFMEDSERIIFGSDRPTNFENDTKDDVRLRAFFRTQLNKMDSNLFESFLGGFELRAIFDAAADYPLPDGQTDIFLWNYHELGYWNEARRGAFPWDMVAWTRKRASMGREEMVRMLHSIQAQANLWIMIES